MATRRSARTPPGTDRTADRDAERQDGERLQKFISRCGVASRRAAEDLITDGRIEVNGQIVTALGTRVDIDTDTVRLDGERLQPQRQRVVLLLNKPVGYLSAQADPENRPLVYRLVPADLALRSIGRLDFNTEGVLLFTNDGDLAERLGHPRYSVQRTYEARVRGVPSEETLAAVRRGVRLEDGPARAESIETIKQTESNAWVRLTLVEGRNREVRRLLERVGHPVVRLRRVAFAGLTVAGLKPGQWRVLLPEEVESLEERGHVGAFELPPDPRRRAGARALAVAAAAREDRKGRRGVGRTAEGKAEAARIENNVRTADLPPERRPRRAPGDPPPVRARRPASPARPAAKAPPPRGKKPTPDERKAERDARPVPARKPTSARKPAPARRNDDRPLPTERKPARKPVPARKIAPDRKPAAGPRPTEGTSAPPNVRRPGGATKRPTQGRRPPNKPKH